jgi:hypothetical protein
MSQICWTMEPVFTTMQPGTRAYILQHHRGGSICDGECSMNKGAVKWKAEI